MRFFAVGGDLRYAFLVRLARARRLDMEAVGLEGAREELGVTSRPLAALSEADALIMPNPWRTGISLPLAQAMFTFADVAERARDNARLLVADAQGKPADFEQWYERYTGGKRLEIVDLAEDEEFVARNAALTAEGALHAAMSGLSLALMDCECMVVGYGRIGRALTERLLGLRASVTVCARRQESRLEAERAGARSICPDAMRLLLGHMRLILSTPPARVFSRDALSLISREALLMDLASPPYGFDLAQATEMGLRAVREPGLPGRYCPESAAKALLGAILRRESISGGN